MVVSKYLIWIKVPSDMPRHVMDDMANILQDAFKNSEFGFFIVPDTFDALSRKEVKEWMEDILRELNVEIASEQ